MLSFSLFQISGPALLAMFWITAEHWCNCMHCSNYTVLGSLVLVRLRARCGRGPARHTGPPHPRAAAAASVPHCCYLAAGGAACVAELVPGMLLVPTYRLPTLPRTRTAHCRHKPPCNGVGCVPPYRVLHSTQAFSINFKHIATKPHYILSIPT